MSAQQQRANGGDLSDSHAVAVVGVLLAVFGAALAGALRDEPPPASPPPEVAVSTAPAAASAPAVETRPKLDGFPIYVEKCAGCHGRTGKGDGPAAAHLDPRPRDFTRGLFKFGSTQPGDVPSDADLARVVRERIYWSAMHPYGDLDDDEVAALVQVIKDLSVTTEPGTQGTIRHFSARHPPRPIDVPPAPPKSPGTLARGRQVFGERCASCHGKAGRGDGELVGELKDGWGYPLRPRDLTVPIYKTGTTARHIFLVVTRGMPGTPMPSFASMDADARWSVALYVESLQHWPESLSAQGELLFDAYGCVTCHGEKGRGGIPNPNAIKENVPRLDTMAQTLMLGDEEDAEAFVDLLQDGKDPLELKDPPDIYQQWSVVQAQYRSVLDVIRKGNPSGRKDPKGVAPPLNMPSWGHQLHTEDVHAVLAYLINLQDWEEDEE